MPNALNGATIALDLDGTLVDTAPDLLRALNVVLDREGLAPFEVASMRPFVGRGARVMIERAGLARGVAFDEHRLTALTEDFVAVYREDIAALSRPFPGCVEALEGLRAAGARLSVCTNKRTVLSVQLLEALGIADRFEAIVGADAVAHRKPHPDHVREAVLRAGGALNRAVMVGDTSVDVSAARAAGAPSVLVLFGYLDAPVEDIGADATIGHFDALEAACRALLR